MDGSTIVFRHLFDLYRYSPDSSEAPVRLEVIDTGDRLDDGIDRRTLENATNAAFSEDGLEIALIAGGDLWVMDTELREPKQITNTAAFESDPVFFTRRRPYTVYSVRKRPDRHLASRAK